MPDLPYFNFLILFKIYEVNYIFDYLQTWEFYNDKSDTTSFETFDVFKI